MVLFAIHLPFFFKIPFTIQSISLISSASSAFIIFLRFPMDAEMSSAEVLAAVPFESRFETFFVHSSPSLASALWSSFDGLNSGIGSSSTFLQYMATKIQQPPFSLSVLFYFILSFVERIF